MNDYGLGQMLQDANVRDSMSQVNERVPEISEPVLILTNDPFKTGNKHYLNMIRPTLAKKRKARNDDPLSKT